MSLIFYNVLLVLERPERGGGGYTEILSTLSSRLFDSSLMIPNSKFALRSNGPRALAIVKSNWLIIVLKDSCTNDSKVVFTLLIYNVPVMDFLL